MEGGTVGGWIGYISTKGGYLINLDERRSNIDH